MGSTVQELKWILQKNPFQFENIELIFIVPQKEAKLTEYRNLKNKCETRIKF